MDYIYALIDPRDNQIRYIGKTKDIKNRLRKHLTENYHSYKVHWIQSLVAIGLKPTLEVIEQVSPEQNWEDREIFWIKHYRDAGYDLTNMTNGGDCGADCTGKKLHTDKFKRELAERNRTRNYNHDQMSKNAKSAWVNPITASKFMNHIKELGKSWTGRKRIIHTSPEQNRINSRKLWDNPEKSAIARAKLIERNKKNKWHINHKAKPG